ncbi:MAG: hypothetical protein A3A86_01240 [Elusimicrobia bacterium RIFCSPLOWO2_01_FULL_60_11]|nr:MAG: hypothetical protein A3A86_01240 [Elusimicrobia bacterium RIFCSPLOWO2_01_FULL_60_11]
MYEVIIEKKFSSAHFLRNYHGHDEPLHGHNWRVEACFAGTQLVQPEEYLVDFMEVHGILDKIIAKVDYKNINDVAPFNKKNPSAENIARWIYDELAAALPAPKPSRVTVWETDSGAASFVPDN